MSYLFDSQDEAPELVVNELSGEASLHCFRALLIAYQAGNVPALGVSHG